MRILLVDDDKQSLDALERILQEAGYESVTAGDGAQALELARKEPPDLVVSEVLLPAMDGFSLLRAWLREPRLKQIPFAFLTGTFKGETDVAFARSLGALRYWQKPMEPKELVEQADNLIQMGRHGMIGHLPEPPAIVANTVRPYDQELVLKLKRNLEEVTAAYQDLKATMESSGPMLVGVEIPPPGSGPDPYLAEERRSATYKISDAVHQAPNLDELFRAIHEIVASLVEARNFTVALHDAEQALITFPYNATGRGDDLAQGLLRGLIEHVLKTGVPFVGSPEAIREFAGQNGLEDPAEKDLAWLGVPLKSVDRIIGVLAIYSTTPRFRYTQADAELLCFVSTQVALAIERKRAEAEMLLLTSAIEQVSEAIFVTDQDGFFVYVNPAFEYHSGYTRADLSGHSTDILRSPDTATEDLDALWTAVRSGRAWCGLLKMKRKDGTPYMAEVAVSPVKNDLGDIAAFVFVQRDVTQELAVHERLQKAKSLETVGLLAQGIAHEVRNPLFAINLNMAAMEKVLGDQTSIRPFMGFIQEQVKRLDVLMKDLLELGQPLDKEEFVPTTVQAILRDVARQAESAGDNDGRLILELSEKPMPIHAVFSKLKLAFLHLVTNAFQNSRPEGRVWLKTDENNLYWIVRIEDEGAGLPANMGDRLFDPFVTSHEGHRGLGLTMVRHYLAEHRGTVTATSNSPKPGATFTVVLPKEEGAAGPPQP